MTPLRATEIGVSGEGGDDAQVKGSPLPRGMRVGDHRRVGGGPRRRPPMVGRKRQASVPETSSGTLVSSLPVNAVAPMVAPIAAAVRVPAARLRAVARVHRYVAAVAVPGTLLLAWQVRRAMLVGQH